MRPANKVPINIPSYFPGNRLNDSDYCPISASCINYAF